MDWFVYEFIDVDTLGIGGGGVLFIPDTLVLDGMFPKSHMQMYPLCIGSDNANRDHSQLYLSLFLFIHMNFTRQYIYIKRISIQHEDLRILQQK